jgi:hypothetical protein
MAIVGRNYTKKQPLKDRQLNTTITYLSRMCSKLLTLVTCDLTQDDIIRTFIRPEHIEVLTAAGEIVRHDKYDFVAKIDQVELIVNVTLKRPKIVVPKYARRPIDYGSLGEKKLVAFVNERLQVLDACYIGVEAIKELNERCDNLMQMRFFLKCLPALGVECSYRVPSDIPDVPKEMRLALRSVDEFVARASMLPEIEVLCEVEEKSDVTVSLGGARRLPIPWRKDKFLTYYV